MMLSSTRLPNANSSRFASPLQGVRHPHRPLTAAGRSPMSSFVARAAAATSLPPDFKHSYIEIAHQLADAAAQITTKYFRTPFDVETKLDMSPVTIADIQAETVMRAVLEQLCPEHGIFGEEHGLKEGSGQGSEYLWVLDPIDGTKSFITGKPLFGTLIALLHNGTPILGIIDQPVLKERWLGVMGQATQLNGSTITTRPCSELRLAYLYATTPHMFTGPAEAAFNRVRDQVRIPMYGCDCYAYGLLAAGLCDLVVESDLKPYDYMALVPIIKGAGGVITDWQGKDLVWKPHAGESKQELIYSWPMEVCAAGDARIHQQALDLLAWI